MPHFLGLGCLISKSDRGLRARDGRRGTQAGQRQTPPRARAVAVAAATESEATAAAFAMDPMKMRRALFLSGDRGRRCQCSRPSPLSLTRRHARRLRLCRRERRGRGAHVGSSLRAAQSPSRGHPPCRSGHFAVAARHLSLRTRDGDFFASPRSLGLACASPALDFRRPDARRSRRGRPLPASVGDGVGARPRSSASVSPQAEAASPRLPGGQD